MLFLTYEGLVADPARGVGRVARFVGARGAADARVIARAVRNSSMAAMRSGEAGVYAGNVRAGGVGKWRERLSAADSALFDEVYREEMAGSGLTFDFGDGVVM